MIDYNRILFLKSLATEKNPHPLSEFIDIYLRDTPRLMSQLQKETEIAGLQKIAHTLKSSSENMGALKVAEIAKTLEQDSNELSEKDRMSLIEGLQTEFASACIELKRIRSSEP